MIATRLIQAAKRPYSDELLFEAEYDCVVVGAGLAGLNTINILINDYGVDPMKILLLEAQSYVGGRVKQESKFVQGMKIDVGAEIIHGKHTSLAEYAKKMNEKISECFVWAQGDDGPLAEPVCGGYGVYYLKEEGQKKGTLLRFDDTEGDLAREFSNTNNILHNLADEDESVIPESHSLEQLLVQRGVKRCEEEETLMSKLVHAGFSNTMCTNNKDMSLRGMVAWKRLWDLEEGDDGDFRFQNSYGVLVDHLYGACKQVPTALHCCVDRVRHGQQAGRVGLDVRRKKKMVAGDNTDDNWGQTHSVTAKCAVVTAPVAVLAMGRIAFEPPLSPKDELALFRGRNMHPATKLLLRFSRRCWPAKLHGTIMAGDGVLIPEAWFKEDKGGSARCVATGFLTAEYATNLEAAAAARLGVESSAPAVSPTVEQEMCCIFLEQLDEVFSLLEPKHMSAAVASDWGQEQYLAGSPGAEEELPGDLPKPSSVFVAGMVYRWAHDTHPFIGGGYSSVKAGTACIPGSSGASVLTQGLHGVFFAGEGTSTPGSTAHCALDTGHRAAAQVKGHLSKYC